MHLHEPALFLSEHIAFDPQGEGLQGSGLSVCLGGTVVILWQAMKAFPVYPGSH